MPQVQIEGVFMGAGIIEREYEGNKRTSLSIDLYQKGEKGNETVKVSSKEVALFQTISESYKLGDKFKCLATVSAYKNNAYYNLQQIVK
ncbi:hypothetical protein [Bacillus thuringiensis]|uniref:Uncharacterized protein n=2 Tax=Bacillus thuringiensis TaxID=1428 RepID=A0ABD5HS36_BACTU|nr:hypothetical protein [Bacillus thuringiensis]EEM92318.1 hypothetical protein bthur0013_63690 [Bacillus thuringiensis IBL 200]MCR6784517.1 hypothetical protein [Bacillus thuringiensis]MCR6863153.1 hypothetical protein [Bacillus thuringiensis]MCR6869426.1 hypothetical protein [Bacillus thuringiensis]MDW9207710.1 hypothetical protein [Bacillus thuringiensis serovar toumanoffi]